MERKSRGRRLLVWDAPNMDMCLSEVIGERATALTRPSFEAVAAWLQERAEPGDELEAAMFVNVARGMEQSMAKWVAQLRGEGFSVFAKPKLGKRDDVDESMLNYISRRINHGGLIELIVASHDGKAFSGPLTKIARDGIPVAVLGYREKDTFGATSDVLSFIDVESVPDAFPRALPRTNLFDLPSSGKWFEPFVRLEAPTDTGAAARTQRPSGVEVIADSSPVEDGTVRPHLPTRAAVLALLGDEVRHTVGAGRSGLSVQAAGKLLRKHFREFRFDELGFESAADLVNALVVEGGYELVRVKDGTHQLRPISQPSSDHLASSVRDETPDEPRTDAAIEPAVPPDLVGRCDPAPQLHTTSADLNPIYRVFRSTGERSVPH